MSFVPAIQSLKSRTLLSAVYEGDLLTVMGTDGNDEIKIERSTGSFGMTPFDVVAITITDSSTRPAQPLLLDPWSFTRLVIRGGAGDDVITLFNIGQRDVVLDGGAGNDTITSQTDTPRVTIVGGEGADHVRAQRAQVDDGPGEDVDEVFIRLAPGEAPFEPGLPGTDVKPPDIHPLPPGAVPVGGAGYVLQKRRGVLFIQGMGEILVTPLDAAGASGGVLTDAYVEMGRIGRIIHGLSAKRVIIAGSFREDVIRLDGHRPGPGGAAGEPIASGLPLPIPATVRAAGGDDIVVGGAANDRLFGGPGNDQLDGAGGHNHLRDRRGRRGHHRAPAIPDIAPF
jgi:Ca2+-binding RTX toxin-like protein